MALVGGHQVLQTLSILIANIRSETNIFYLFSNNYINELICTPFDFDDDEIIGYYINLLKAIRWAPRPGQLPTCCPQSLPHGHWHTVLSRI